MADVTQIVAEAARTYFREGGISSSTLVGESATSRQIVTEKKSISWPEQWDIKFDDGVVNYSLRKMFIDWYRTTSTSNNTVASFITMAFEIRDSWHPHPPGKQRDAGVTVYDQNGNLLLDVPMGKFSSVCKQWKQISLKRDVDPMYYDAGQMVAPYGGGTGSVSQCP
jgi:hypothetical protein